MILGIGIDSVDIARLSRWTSFSQTQLQRIFHINELTYCFQSPLKTPERLAARFAAREAFFKALSPHALKQPLPFLTICKAIHVQNGSSGAPELIVQWDFLAEKGYFRSPSPIKTHISLTHTPALATALVILEYR